MNRYLYNLLFEISVFIREEFKYNHPMLYVKTENDAIYCILPFPLDIPFPGFKNPLAINRLSFSAEIIMNARKGNKIT